VNLPLRCLIVLVMVITTLSACEAPNFGRAVLAENNTDSPLSFEAILDGETLRLAAIAEPGESAVILGWARFNTEYSRITEGECTKVDLVALDPDGREVARHAPPLCLDDVWVIGGESRGWPTWSPA
jgi:hypothetical protein